MTSSMNNNSTLQTNTTSSNSAEFNSTRPGSSSTVNAMRTHRYTHDAASSHRDRPSRGGHGGRSRRGGLTDRPANNIKKPSSIPNRSPQDASSNLEEPIRDGESSIQDSSTSNSNAGRVIGYKSSSARGGGGKYSRRHQANQLLDGMSSITGLDIDLAENLLPTGPSGRVTEVGKGRHATNNRKVNLSHLLNYNLERRQRGGNRHQSSDGTTGPYHRNISSHYRDPGTCHKFSKQQFLQANCQFVVLDGHDYTVHKADPDWPVDWDCIEEVRFKQSASSETTCPICLEPPVAAKITRCGHIYCWTCMLHYLSLSDENCRQCPICFEPVYRGDLRSVVSHSFTNYSVDDNIVMRLMVRKKGCVEVEPCPRESHGCPEINPSSALEQPSTIDGDQYWSKDNLVIVDSSTVVANIAQRERNELLLKLELDRDEPEVCFIEQALSWLDKRVTKLLQSTSNETKVKAQDRTGPLSNNEGSKSYLFYQCFDGQHIYLNPFSTKILCHEYNDLEHCPFEIRSKILQMDWISMSEAWRKRFRYLEHLPLTCEFRLIEIDFEKSNLISPHTYKVFESQIRMREQEREQRRREERKREKIIQVEQNRNIYGIQPTLKINLDNTDQFPSVSDQRYLGLSNRRFRTNTNEIISSEDEEYDETRTVDNPPDVQPKISEPDKTVVADSDSSTDVVSNVTLSFKDIQLQEAVLASRSAKDKSKSSSVWAGKGQGSSSGPQSSFAQLLVDAKTSQKQWTRNINPAPETPQVTSASYRPNTTASGSDDGGEELRAPPGEFTISDFIDLNIVSSTGKKKGKPKGGKQFA